MKLEIERSLEQETNEILAWTRDDSKSLEMFLQDESKPREFIRKCQLHSLDCKSCKIINKINSDEEEQIITEMMNNQKEVPNNDGSFRIEQKVSYKRDTNVIFHSRNSNLHRAGKQCKALIQKSFKEDAEDYLPTHIRDAIDDQVLSKLS